MTPYLSQNDPASLALVDRDACQLAYSIQFTNVQSDYGNVALGLATQLLQERIPVSGDRQYGTKPSVGSCIVRLERMMKETASRDSNLWLRKLYHEHYNYARCQICHAEFRTCRLARKAFDTGDYQHPCGRSVDISRWSASAFIMNSKCTHPEHFSNLETLELQIYWQIQSDVEYHTTSRSKSAHPRMVYSDQFGKHSFGKMLPPDTDIAPHSLFLAAARPVFWPRAGISHPCRSCIWLIGTPKKLRHSPSFEQITSCRLSLHLRVSHPRSLTCIY